MAFSLRTNVSSLSALESGRLTQRTIVHSTRAISSGTRIHQASVDPSGLAISEGMRAQIGGLRVATENIQDDIRLIHTADGALSTMHDILFRIRDLALRASNQAVWTNREMDIFNNEIKLLSDELARAVNAVKFNTKTIFEDVHDDGDTTNGEYAITKATAAQIVAFGGQEAYDKFVEKIKDMIPAAMDRVFEYYGLQKDLETDLTISLDFSYAGPALATGGGTSNSLSMQFNTASFAGMTDEDISSVLTHEMGHCITSGENVNGTDATNWAQEMLSQYVSQEVNDRIPDAGLPAQIAGALDAVVALANADYARAALSAQYIYEKYGREAWVNIIDYMKENPGATFNGNGGAIVAVLGTGTWAAFETAVDAYSTTANNNSSVTADPEFTFKQMGSRQMRFRISDNMQVGADSNEYNRFDAADSETIVDFRFLAARTLKVAQRTIDNADHAIESVSDMRAKLGVSERRLLHTLDDVHKQIINVSQARSKIFDADIAVETASLTKATIIQQSNQAALTYANVMNKAVLDLLR